jgi:hypothetical protein
VAPPSAQGIVVSATELLSGRITARNGPWLAQRLDKMSGEMALGWYPSVGEEQCDRQAR